MNDSTVTHRRTRSHRIVQSVLERIRSWLRRRLSAGLADPRCNQRAVPPEMKPMLLEQTDAMADLLQQLVALSSKNLSELKLTNLKSTTQKAA